MEQMSRFGRRDQFADADGYNDPVQRLPAAVFLEQPQEADPGGLVGVRIAVLARVASGGVDQHRLVGEPPITAPGSPDAANAAASKFVGQREIQAGIRQRRGLPAAGRADQDVPRKLIQPAPASRLAEAALLQGVQRFAQTTGDRLDLLRSHGSTGGRDGIGEPGILASLLPLVERHGDTHDSGHQRSGQRTAYAGA